MLLANFDRKEHLQYRAVSLRQHGFLVYYCYRLRVLSVADACYVDTTMWSSLFALSLQVLDTTYIHGTSLVGLKLYRHWSTATPVWKINKIVAPRCVSWARNMPTMRLWPKGGGERGKGRRRVIRVLRFPYFQPCVQFCVDLVDV